MALINIACNQEQMKTSLQEKGPADETSNQRSSMQRLTRNFTTFPSTQDVKNEIDSYVSAPVKNCPTTVLVEEKQEEIVLSSKEPLCDYPDLGKNWISNCEKLFKESDVPKDALAFSMKAFAKNMNKFSSNKCYKMMNSGHYSMKGTNKSNFNKMMEKGIPNKCQIMINDTTKKLPKAHKDARHFRRQMYYIDLCKEGGPKVTKGYFNLGTGTFKNKYKNSEGNRTTVLGAFLTNTKVFDLSFQKKPYKKLRKSLKKKMGKSYAPGLQLFGLQKTNNNASKNAKYLHVSPYQSSFGCPSVNEDNYWMMEELAKNGPSLVVNYGPDKKMEDINKCSQ